MLLEHKNAIVYGGGARSAARWPAHSPARRLKCFSPVEPLSRSKSREAFPTIGGTVVAWAAIEAQCRQWVCELGPQGVRVVWLRTTGLPEAIADAGDATANLGTGYGEGMTREQIIAGMRDETILRKLASLDELGKIATFMASDGAGPMTATFANITCGAILD